jgi:hypothetical protein
VQDRHHPLQIALVPHGVDERADVAPAETSEGEPQAAADEVAETDAALVWPARLVWADPETVTSLIERHGVSAQPLLRPTYDGRPGWPALVPMGTVGALAALGPDRMPDELIADLQNNGVAVELVDVGDPGVVLDRDTAIDALPTYQGPPEPTGGPPPEWGVADAGESDEALEGPGLRPYGQAADPEASSEA